MTDEIIDKHDVGIPDSMVRLRHDTEVFRNEAEKIRDQTQILHDEAHESADRAAGEASAAEDAARRASSWIDSAEGLSLGPEPPIKPREGHIWLVESSKPTHPLYPSLHTWPGPHSWPGKVGLQADGRHIITGIRHMDHGQWVDYRIAAPVIEMAQEDAS